MIINPLNVVKLLLASIIYKFISSVYLTETPVTEEIE